MHLRTSRKEPHALAAERRSDQEVGMVERAGGPRFGLESLEALRIRGSGAGQDLDRDVPAEARVQGTITSPMPPEPIRPSIS